MALFLVGFAALDIARGYERSLAAGRLRASGLAHVLDEQTRRSVQAVDVCLQNVIDALRLRPDTPSHDPAFTRMLQLRLRDLPYVRALFVIGANGFLIQDTDPGTPHVSLADRAYFRVHKDNPDSDLYIGEPLVSRSTQIGSPWFVSVSRRITLLDGRFYGVAVAAIEPKYFARFYADLDVGAGDTVTLIHRSGHIVARYPREDGAVGESLMGRDIFDQMLRAPSGGFDRPSVVDGVERIFAYRAVAPYPLLVAVGLDKSGLLHEWWRNTQMMAAVTALCILALLAAVIAFIRMRGRERLVAERLHQVDKSEALGRMTSSVAHDFNNILTVVCGNLAVLSETLQGDPRRGRAEGALAAADRGVRLVSELLAFSRRRPAALTSEDLSGLLRDMASLLRQAASPAALVFDCAEGLWPCDVDRGQFERAVMNLVVNARDAMPRGGTIAVSTFNLPRAAFELRAWSELAPGDYVGCRIRDEGTGMPPEVIARACDPFFTTKGEGAGTGLGLSQAHTFAQQCGGSLQIESAVDAGTTITILLPRASPRIDAPPR